jgi:hypothetical protein
VLFNAIRPLPSRRTLRRRGAIGNSRFALPGQYEQGATRRFSMIPGFSARRRFADLSEQEVLALAISSEEDDASIYRTYAERLRADFPQSAAVFDGMAREEDKHRARLIALHKRRFGEVIPLVRREHVAGFTLATRSG